MRSNINLVTNNVDIVTMMRKILKIILKTLNSEMAKQMMKTKHLCKKVDEVDLKANIGITFDASGCVLGWGTNSIDVGGKELSTAIKLKLIKLFMAIKKLIHFIIS